MSPFRILSRSSLVYCARAQTIGNGGWVRINIQPVVQKFSDQSRDSTRVTGGGRRATKIELVAVVVVVATRARCATFILVVKTEPRNNAYLICEIFIKLMRLSCKVLSATASNEGPVPPSVATLATTQHTIGRPRVGKNHCARETPSRHIRFAVENGRRYNPTLPSPRPELRGDVNMGRCSQPKTEIEV